MDLWTSARILSLSQYEVRWNNRCAATSSTISHRAWPGPYLEKRRDRSGCPEVHAVAHKEKDGFFFPETIKETKEERSGDKTRSTPSCTRPMTETSRQRPVVVKDAHAKGQVGDLPARRRARRRQAGEERLVAGPPRHLVDALVDHLPSHTSVRTGNTVLA